MSDEWGPWIEHDGKGCPCVGSFVHVVHLYITGDTRHDFAVAGSSGGLSWDWRNWPLTTKITRYRIRKPRGLTILEELLEKLPAPEREGADA